MDIESVWRENKWKEIYQKLKAKYQEFCGKYWDAQRWLCKEGDMPALREELKKKDERLMVAWRGSAFSRDH